MDLDSSSIEDNFIAMANGELFEDADFPPQPASLYKDGQNPPEYALGEDQVIWYRPDEFSKRPDYFKAQNGCTDVQIGSLHDSWFLGVVGAMAMHPDGIIENLFVSELDDFKKYGIYTCRFYKDCEWITVACDTKLPYSSRLSDDDAHLVIVFVSSVFNVFLVVVWVACG